MKYFLGMKRRQPMEKDVLRMLNDENLTAMIRPVSNAFLDFFITNNPGLIQPPVTLHVNPCPTETFSSPNRCQQAPSQILYTI